MVSFQGGAMDVGYFVGYVEVIVLPRQTIETSHATIEPSRSLSMGLLLEVKFREWAITLP
jgi:hypothetical protein